MEIDGRNYDIAKVNNYFNDEKKMKDVDNIL